MNAPTKVIIIQVPSTEQLYGSIERSVIMVCKGAWHARLHGRVQSTDTYVTILIDAAIKVHIPITKQSIFFFNYSGSEIKDSFSCLDFFEASEGDLG